MRISSFLPGVAAAFTIAALAIGTAQAAPKRYAITSAGALGDGLVDSPIENVKFENCKIAAQKGFVMENARKVDLSGLTVEVKEGEPIVKRNVQ